MWTKKEVFDIIWENFDENNFKILHKDLNEVKEFDNSVGSDENYNRALRNYKIAKENVLFKGFSIKERNCNSSFFKYIENGFIAVYYFNEKLQKFEPNTDFKTIEDLIPYNLEILKKWEAKYQKK